MQNAEFQLNRYISSSLLKNSTFNIFFSLSTTVRAKRKEKLYPCMYIYFQTKTDITRFYILNYNFRTSSKNAVMSATNETQYRTPWRVSCQRTPLELAVISLNGEFAFWRNPRFIGKVERKLAKQAKEIEKLYFYFFGSGSLMYRYQ